MRDQINAALKTAMLAQDKPRVSALRMIAAAIKNADIEARGQGKEAPGDDAVLGLLQKLVKQRQESAELYDKGGRPELAAAERAEIAIIRSFLPEQIGDDEMRSLVAEAVKSTGATGVRDIGKVMAALRARYAGRMDFARASGVVKSLLG